MQMENLHAFIFLIFASALLIGAAQKLQISYPIVLVIGGTLIGFIPGLKPLHIDPNTLLFIVLPPILYASSFSISFREFKKNWKEIFSLALGLVVITTLIAGLIFKSIFPQFPWALAFTFGAIISPPDAVAASAILKRFSINTRLLTILEGESLINDASALVLYRIAITALLSGVFSLAEAGYEFVWTVAGGIAVGLAFGIFIQQFSRRFLGALPGIVLSLTIPYITYSIAHHLNVSGVLAVVTNGLVGSQIIFSHPSPLRRILGFAMWDIYSIFLNCFIFILIGLHLKILTSEMTSAEVYSNIGYGILFTFVLIAVRMLWLYLRNGINWFKKSNRSDNIKTLKEDTLIGWAGMRGIVSLTVALALPLTLSDGTALDGREEVVFITFIVILLTLLIPGLTLAPLIRWLNLNSNEQATDHKITQELAKIAKNKIEELNLTNGITPDQFKFLNNYFHMQNYALEVTSSVEKFQETESIRLHIIQEQRKELLQLWKEHKATDQQLTRLERELDIEETRLARAELI